MFWIGLNLLLPMVKQQLPFLWVSSMKHRCFSMGQMAEWWQLLLCIWVCTGCVWAEGFVAYDFTNNSVPVPSKDSLFHLYCYFVQRSSHTVCVHHCCQLKHRLLERGRELYFILLPSGALSLSYNIPNNINLFVCLCWALCYMKI